jgi:hypothetical protein
MPKLCSTRLGLVAYFTGVGVTLAVDEALLRVVLRVGGALRNCENSMEGNTFAVPFLIRMTFGPKMEHCTDQLMKLANEFSIIAVTVGSLPERKNATGTITTPWRHSQIEHAMHHVQHRLRTSSNEV